MWIGERRALALTAGRGLPVFRVAMIEMELG
jgi:hypothetical protein